MGQFLVGAWTRVNRTVLSGQKRATKKAWPDGSRQAMWRQELISFIYSFILSFCTPGLTSSAQQSCEAGAVIIPNWSMYSHYKVTTKAQRGKATYPKSHS